MDKVSNISLHFDRKMMIIRKDYPMAVTLLACAIPIQEATSVKIILRLSPYPA